MSEKDVITDNSVDADVTVFTEEEILKMVSDYQSGTSMRVIAKTFGTNHKRVSRILKKHGICTRARVNNNTRGFRKFKNKLEVAYHNMKTHIRFDVELEWYLKFTDINKVKHLNQCITRRGGRWDVDTMWYKSYIEKFYDDVQFNIIYNNWIASGMEFYMMPSIDHIIPKTKGGTNDLDNLQFLTWFENRCKNNLSQQEWDNMKANIKDYLI